MNKKIIKVLMCCSDLKRVKGGMVTMVTNLLESDSFENCKISYIPTHIETNNLLKIAYFSLAYIRIFFRLLTNGADILHLHVSEKGSVYRKQAVLKLAHFFKKKVVLHHHGADFNVSYSNLSEKGRRFVVKFIEEADMNLVLSEGVMEDFKDKAPHGKYMVVRNAVKVSDTNPYTGNENLIVTMGRLGERKGTYDLLKALKDIEASLPENIKFCLCGDGEVEKVKELVRECGLSERVEHIGWVSGEKKDKITENMLCHVLPSYREVLPMSILESMAKGIPNISTKIASIPEVITDGEDGILIEPGDTESLKAALIKICTQKEERLEMSRKAHKLISTDYSVIACSKKLSDIYRGIAG